MRGTSLERSTMAPIPVRLGTEVFKLQVLTFRESQEWSSDLAHQYVNLVTKFRSSVTQESSSEMQMPTSMLGSFKDLFFAVPDEIIKTVQTYDIKKVIPEESFYNASPEQINEVFTTLLEVVFPFTSSIGLAIQSMRVANLVM